MYHTGLCCSRSPLLHMLSPVTCAIQLHTFINQPNGCRDKGFPISLCPEAHTEVPSTKLLAGPPLQDLAEGVGGAFTHGSNLDPHPSLHHSSQKSRLSPTTEPALLKNFFSRAASCLAMLCHQQTSVWKRMLVMTTS